MKRQFLALLVTAVFAAVFATNASGQTRNTTRSNVRFNFQIGDRVYPAGEYQIESISSQCDNILVIRTVGNPSKNQIIVANHTSAVKGQTPRLVFLKHGGRYFLSQIFLDSGQGGYSITPSRLQLEGEKNLASRLPRTN